jgi:hypothetical protein
MTNYYGLNPKYYKENGKEALKKTFKWKIMLILGNLLAPEWIPLKYQFYWGLFLLRIFGFVTVKKEDG